MHIKHAKNYPNDFDLNFILTQKGKHIDLVLIDMGNEAQRNEYTRPRLHSPVDTQTQILWFQIMLIDS